VASQNVEPRRTRWVAAAALGGHGTGASSDTQASSVARTPRAHAEFCIADWHIAGVRCWASAKDSIVILSPPRSGKVPQLWLR
jgi:hypothetical protein